MEKIGFCGALLFLVFLTPEDIREKTIKSKTVFLWAGGAMLYRCAGKQLCAEDIVCALMPGLLLLLLGFLTAQSIGYGDALAVMVLGLWTNGGFTLAVVVVAILCTGMWSSVCLFLKRTEPVAFIPFLLLGMEVVLGSG